MTDEFIGKDFLEIKETISTFSKVELENIIIDEYYNSFMCRVCNYETDEKDKHGHGKRIPYIGLFWRSINFSKNEIPIARAEGKDGFIGFIPYNKWWYDERNLTKEEFTQTMKIIDEAMILNDKATSKEGRIKAKEKLEELWDYFQTLKIEN